MKPSPAGRSLGPTYLPLGVKYSGQHLTEHHIARGAHSACTQCEGELDESIWKKLEDEMLADRATIAHHRAHLAVLTRNGEGGGTRQEAQDARHRPRSRPSSGGRSRRR